MRFVALFLIFASAGFIAVGDRPNIVLIMADDMGFSDLGCYGSEIHTPNLDRLAAGGVRFTQFYNNGKCAPTRASLLTGLYSQQVGCHNEPVRMERCITIAEALRPTGYRTLMVGKWHAEELPTDRGFDRYFGLADGCANFFNPGEPRPGEPAPAEKNFPRKWSKDGDVMRPFTPDDRKFYATDAFTDAALEYLDEYEHEDKPYFLYVAYTAPHYPLHAHPDDIAKYRGRYLSGWDALRRERHNRMIELGVVDARWPLAPRDERVPAWEDIGNRDAWDLSRLREADPRGLRWEDARDADAWDLKMAVYAAMIDRMDQNIGRIFDKIRAQGEERNTLVLFLSDNGGCAELVHITPDVPPGPVNSYRTVDPPWANAQNTPFRNYKSSTHEGGIATPLIAYWPDTLKGGRISHEVGHLIDLMPTFLDVAGVDSVQAPTPDANTSFEGQSLLPILRGGSWETPRSLFWQFNRWRAVRSGDWKLVQGEGNGAWALYNLAEDRTELNDRASEEPERVREMVAAWAVWAERVGAR
jgi:arylsulfatase A-like enzyme